MKRKKKRKRGRIGPYLKKVVENDFLISRFELGKVGS